MKSYITHITSKMKDLTKLDIERLGMNSMYTIGTYCIRLTTDS